jgi:beta-glucanase (GH16 family)
MNEKSGKSELRKARSVLIAVSLSLVLPALPAWAITKQAIAFPPLTKSVVIGTSQRLLAKSSSGLPVSYKTTPVNTCDLVKSKNSFYVRALLVGTCTVTAKQKGNNRFAPAKSVIHKFLITPPVAIGGTPAPTPTPSVTPAPLPTPTPTPTPTPSVIFTPSPPTPTPQPIQVGTGLPRSQLIAGSTALLGVVDKTQFSTAWAMYYGAGLAYKDAYVNQGSTFTLTWLVTNSLGNPLANQNVTLQANKGYSGSTATFIYNSTVIPNSSGTNDGGRFAGTTNSSGYVSFSIKDISTSAEPSTISVTTIDPLAQANGGIYGQFALQIGTLPQISQSMDIVDVHIISTSNSVTPLPTPTPSALVIGNLLWSDEFKGTAGAQASTSYWTSRYCGHSAANGGGTCYNNEQQYYIPEAIAQDGTSDGNLVITTTRISKAPAGAGTCYVGICSFTSGRLDTQGKVSFKYGYIEARIKVPSGLGNWPAFWALGTNITTVGWPTSGEIDIQEAGGDQPKRTTGATHYPDAVGGEMYEAGENISSANYSDGFHLYALAWTPNHIQLLVDGHVFLDETPSTIRSTNWVYNEPFFLILNNAVGLFGGSWATLNNSTMTIDYVRAYQLNGFGEVFKS